MTQSSPAQQDRKLARLSQVLKTLRETVELETLLEATEPFLCQELGYSLVWFGLYNRAQDCLVGCDVQSPGSKPVLHRARLPLEPGSLLEQVFVERRPVRVADLRQERKLGNWQAIAQAINIQGTLIFPLHYRNVSYGVAVLGVPEWGRTPPPDEMAALSIVCGQLAVAIYQAEALKKEQQQKRPEEPLLRLLDQLRLQPTLEAQLEQIVAETHPFVGAQYTLLYWYDGDRRIFIPRIFRQHQGSAPPPLAVADCERLYQSLKRDRILTISDTDSALQSDLSTYLQSAWQVRSLLLAPIGSGAGLLGFLAVAGRSPHLWSDGEKRYLEGVAQLATLVAPQERVEQALSQGQAEQTIITQLGQGVRRNQDWTELLRQTSDYLFSRLGIDRLLLVQPQTDSDAFSILFQHQAARRKLLAGPLAALEALDRSLLSESSRAASSEHYGGFVIEDWRSDLRLMRWRSQLYDKAGVQSLLVCPVLPGDLNTGAVVVTREQPKSWTGEEQRLIQSIAQQLATVLHQRSLQQEIQQLQNLQQALRRGLMSLQQENHPQRVDEVGLRVIAKLLKSNSATFLSWSPRNGIAQVTAHFATEPRFKLPEDFRLDTLQDPLMQQLLQSCEGFIIQPLELLPAPSRQWIQQGLNPGLSSGLNSGLDPGLDPGKNHGGNRETAPATLPQQVLLLTVADPSNHVPQGAILLVESKRRLWSEPVLEVAQLLVQQWAGSRHSSRRLHSLQQRQIQLEQLNWYKQFCGERSQLSLAGTISRLQESDGSKLSVSGRQSLERIGRVLGEMEQVFQTEQWEFHSRPRKVPVISLLKRAKEQLDPKISQQKLWCQFHWSDVQHYQIEGELLQLAAVIQTVMVAACDRCLLSGRLDVWCRSQPEGILDFSITDNGILDPLLLDALQPDADPNDPLVQAMTEVDPGLSLRLSQAILGRLGGSLELLPLEDGRTVSRLLIPGLSPS